MNEQHILAYLLAKGMADTAANRNKARVAIQKAIDEAVAAAIVGLTDAQEIADATALATEEALAEWAEEEFFDLGAATAQATATSADRGVEKVGDKIKFYNSTEVAKVFGLKGADAAVKYKDLCLNGMIQHTDVLNEMAAHHVRQSPVKSIGRVNPTADRKGMVVNVTLEDGATGILNEVPAIGDIVSYRKVQAGSFSQHYDATAPKGQGFAAGLWVRNIVDGNSTFKVTGTNADAVAKAGQVNALARLGVKVNGIGELA